MKGWYYVKGSERVGPVDETELQALVHGGELTGDSYVWRKGFDNWRHMHEVDELVSLLEVHEEAAPSPGPELPETIQTEADERPGVNWSEIDEHSRQFHIKVGVDRGGDEAEYGPFSLREMKQLFDDQRVNAKTFVFTMGMANWTFLGDLPIYQEFFSDLPPKIEAVDRRVSVRRPFVARLLFHDNAVVYEGICRDISVGGLQILVSDFPARVGEEITMNVHPDNGRTTFVAKGVVVRLLDGNQGFSLRFHDLNQEARQAIESYLKQS